MRRLLIFFLCHFIDFRLLIKFDICFTYDPEGIYINIGNANGSLSRKVFFTRLLNFSLIIKNDLYTHVQGLVVFPGINMSFYY